MRRLRQHLVATYLSFDPRSLGLFRILLGIVLLGDLVFRYLGVDYWYTDGGLIPSTRLLHEVGPELFSPFLWASTHAQAVFGMALCALVYACFTVGFRTRLFHFLSLLAVVSLNKRVYMLESGGQYVITLLCLWSLFLPLGRRFSIDALGASLRARRERSAEDLADRGAMRPDTTPVVSLAVLALLLQFAAIYFFNVAHKTGPAWMDGSAVYLVLHHEREVTTFGVWAREHLPFAVLRLMSWTTLVVEASAVVLLLSPLWSRHLRLAAVLLLPALHIGFALGLNVGIFSYAMSVYFALLLAPEHWEWLERRRRRGPRRTAYFDATCGLCFQFARIFARCDPGERVRFVANTDPGLPEGIPREVVAAAIVVADPGTGRVWVGARAMAAILGTLPGGRLLALPLRLPGLSRVADIVYRAIARNRTAISRRLGLAACGLPGTPAAGEGGRDRPRRRLAARAARALGEIMVAVLIVAAVGDLARNSPAWPDRLRFRMPAALDALIAYPRTRQYWRMFAPEPTRRIVILVVEAETVDGRTVDPFNEVASRYPRVSLEDPAGIPERMGNNLLFSRYSVKSTRDNTQYLREPLRAWIYRYHERTGNPRDRIVGFRAYRVSCRPPAHPGEVNSDIRRSLVFDGR